MEKLRNQTDLLDLCLWDLAEGTRRVAEILPSVLEQVCNQSLKLLLQELLDEVISRSKKYFESSRSAEGPSNLWVTGLVEDACRDLQSIPHGRLLDMAIIGSTRKMLGAETASIETALALAGEGGDERADDITRMREDCTKRDRALRDLLLAFAAAVSAKSEVLCHQVTEGEGSV